MEEAERVVRRQATQAHKHSRQLKALRRRVAELESEMQESRRLNRQLAELTDVVSEVLVPAADRDDSKLREVLESYSKTL